MKSAIGPQLSKEIPEAVSRVLKSPQTYQSLSDQVAKKVTGNIDQLITASVGAAVNPAIANLSTLVESKIGGTLDFFPFRDLATIGDPNDDAFSFKDLIQASIDGDQSVLLFSTGCEIDGVEDCTRACNQTETFFGSLETFYNCIALASISHTRRRSVLCRRTHSWAVMTSAGLILPGEPMTLGSSATVTRNTGSAFRSAT